MNIRTFTASVLWVSLSVSMFGGALSGCTAGHLGTGVADAAPKGPYAISMNVPSAPQVPGFKLSEETRWGRIHLNLECRERCGPKEYARAEVGVQAEPARSIPVTRDTEMFGGRLWDRGVTWFESTVDRGGIQVRRRDTAFIHRSWGDMNPVQVRVTLFASDAQLMGLLEAWAEAIQFAPVVHGRWECEEDPLRPDSCGGPGFARLLQNPYAPSPPSIERGRALYQELGCAKCHGVGGRGDGPAPSSMDPPPRDFTHPIWQKARTDGEIRFSILAGVEGTEMVSSEALFDDPDDVWHVVNFIRTLKE
jgi:hypothetical protein